MTTSNDLAGDLSAELAAPLPGMPDALADPAPARPKSRRKPAGERKERTPRQPSSRPRPRATPLAPRVAQAHVLLGMGLSFAPIPNGPATGRAMAENADNIGQAWEQLAKENPRVREALEKLLTASAVGQLAMAYVPVLLAAAGRADVLVALGGIAESVSTDPAAPTENVPPQPVPDAA